MQLEELTDSRLLYERRPPRFGYILIAAVLVALAGTVLWAANTAKPSVATGTGAVESDNRTYIMSSVSGAVNDVLTPNGTTVDRDEAMITIESVDLDIEREATIVRIAQLQKSLALQERYTAAVDARENTFDAANPDEAPFYYQFDALASQRWGLRADPDSLRAIGYSEVEIANVVRSNQLKIDQLESAALGDSATRATDLRGQIDQLTTHLAGLDAGSAQYTVRAAASGEVTLNPDLKPGTIISAGEPVGTIASPDSGLEVRVYLEATQRQFVNVGDTARVAVAGLPPLAYDSIDGIVTTIDSDVTTVAPGDAGPSTASSGQYFGATIRLDKYWVEGRDGVRRDLGNGTAVTSEIVYTEISYLEYFAELVGIR